MYQAYFDQREVLRLRPLVDLRFSTDRYLCLNGDHLPLTESKKSYPLYSQKFDGCDHFG